MSRRSAPCYVVRIGSAGRYVGAFDGRSLGIPCVDIYGHLLLAKVDRQRDAMRFARRVAREVAKVVDPIDAVVVRLTPPAGRAG